MLACIVVRRYSTPVNQKPISFCFSCISVACDFVLPTSLITCSTLAFTFSKSKFLIAWLPSLVEMAPRDLCDEWLYSNKTLQMCSKWLLRSSSICLTNSEPLPANWQPKNAKQHCCVYVHYSLILLSLAAIHYHSSYTVIKLKFALLNTWCNSVKTRGKLKILFNRGQLPIQERIHVYLCAISL